LTLVSPLASSAGRNELQMTSVPMRVGARRNRSYRVSTSSWSPPRSAGGHMSQVHTE
jgi:hypothetical protein